MIGTFDLTDPATFHDGPPLQLFAALRRSDPVSWHPPTGRYPGFWVLSRYHDIQRVLGSPTVFINARGITIEPTEPAGLDPKGPERGQGALSYTDPPRHRELRKVLARHFTPGRLRRLEPQLATQAERLVAEFVASGGGDAVEAFSDRYPLLALSCLLDLPAATSSALGAFVAAVAARPPGVMDEPRSSAARNDFLGAMADLADLRRRRPGDDLISDLVGATGQTGELVAQRLSGTLIQLAIAGHETTKAALSHGAWLLAEHQGAQELFRTQPAMASAVVEEILRYRPPVLYIRRTANQDALVGEGAGAQQVKAGAVIYLSVASANRDEAVYAQPDTFNVRRFAGGGAHLALGFAEHHCLGAATARTELRCLLAALVTATSRFGCSGPVVRATSNTFVDGVSYLPLSATGHEIGAKR